ncbi:ABC transporter permease [Corynebacterium uropygiale]|uniref:ABC transporter permease n=1 Tax=Corynebacterium uropygiale TaxID=1775911 RepID=A0A9X1TZX7_9CORY|nr:ABC transporter permease [Corynebacterium uropygiale]MCF4007401.1 ABC transporter permease [Corynebacterium uropygiale]
MASALRRISVRNIRAHKLRLVLTLLAVVLGTAFIAGAMMFTRSLEDAFDSAVSSQFDGVDAVVSGDAGVPLDVREDIAKDPKVGGVSLEASTTVVLANQDHKAIQTGGQTASLRPYDDSPHTVGEGATISEGRAPSGPEEVAINSSAAEKYHLSVGDRLFIVDPHDRYDVTISGLTSSEVEDSGAGTLSLRMAEQDYLARYAPDRTVSQLKVAAAEGTSADDLVSHLEATHPELTVKKGSALAEQASKAMSDALQFVNYFLASFGLVALLVGSFLIANTFSMIVAQRTKEFALLRALGASRRQVVRSVIHEAIIVGLIGSALGILGGIGLVALIRAILSAFDMALPGHSLGINPTAIIAPLVIGLVITLASAWVPARRAGRVEPVEAMREAEQDTRSSILVRSIVGGILVIIGIVAALVPIWMEGSETRTRAILVGVGAVALTIGFSLCSPALSQLVVPGIGKVVGLPFRAVGSLAATNSRRHPKRTATTAFALTLGVALVTAIGAFGDTMKTAVADMTETSISADFLLSGPRSGNFPIPDGAIDAVRDTDGVENVTTGAAVPISVGGITSPYGQTYSFDGDPAHIFELTILDGESDLSNRDGVLLDKDTADANNWHVGDSVPLALASIAMPGVNPMAGGEQEPPSFGEVPVLGIYEGTTMLNGPVISRHTIDERMPGGAVQTISMGVQGKPGVDHDELRGRIEKAVEDFIVVQVQDQDDLADQGAKAVDSMLNILYGLLALAVVIAILGIVNTLTLNIIERRREIGMLRAVGMKRFQVRQMITLEAVQIAVYGAVAGIVIGAFLAWAFLRVLSGTGLDTVSFPVLQIIAMLVGSAVVGVIAAIWPARRAAATPPLDAVAD